VTETIRRATPAEPWPGAKDEGLPSPTGRSLPPELGPNAIAVLEGVTFMYSDASGDVPPGSIGGLVHADTRLLSTWVLTVNGQRLLPLRSGSVEHYAAAFFLTSSEAPGRSANEIGVRRLRSIGTALRERIELWCFARERGNTEVRLSVGSDFADLFEIKDVSRDRSEQIVREHAPDGSGLAFTYRNGRFIARTVVSVSPPATRVEGDDLVWDLDFCDDATWAVDITVPLSTVHPRDGLANRVAPERAGFGEVAGEPADDAMARWLSEIPSFFSDSDLLRHIGDQTARDILALRVEARLNDHAVILPAAGLPWFLTVFGRDTIITAFQSVAFGPQLARGALLQLASTQGTEYDDFRDEEPGKIMHEIRQGELTVLGLKPHSPYYGAADSTMLWLILLSEYWRWTGDSGLLRDLQPNALAALAWIDAYGDLDGDGYVEYQTRSPQGLGNQCWRDSWDGVQFADGRLPYLPVATCELQGYVYDAKRRMAELLRGPLADPALAARLEQEAAALKERFNRDFWVDDRGGYYAIGLDGDKQRIDSMTSNMGHLLWSGIVPTERAEVVVRQLMSTAMFSGWGVRTLSTKDSGYNPIGYHAGTVWPHDNSIIALGLAKYGYREEANTLALAMFEAAEFSNYRLPEAFSGYARSVSRFPVPYPTACSPQAFATGAPMLFLRVMLGLDVIEGVVTIDPVIPPEIGRVQLNGVYAAGACWDVTASGHAGTVGVCQRR
jgi:glycogen debranching enzyme